MQMSDTIIIRGDVIMITRKAEKYINNWIKKSCPCIIGYGSKAGRKNIYYQKMFKG